MNPETVRTNELKKLGVIGGAGPLASSLFYESLIFECYKHNYPVPEIVLINHQFTHELRHLITEDTHPDKTIERHLVKCTKTLAESHVGSIIIACNSLHIYLPFLAKEFGIDFFSIPEAVLRNAHQGGYSKLLILGTQNTYYHDLYNHPEIATLAPPPNDQKNINEILVRIFDGKILIEDSLTISKIVKRLSSELDFDGVILGCTELPVLHHYHPFSFNKPIFDSIKLPAREILDHLHSKKQTPLPQTGFLNGRFREQQLS